MAVGVASSAHEPHPNLVSVSVIKREVFKEVGDTFHGMSCHCCNVARINSVKKGCDGTPTVKADTHEMRREEDAAFLACISTWYFHHPTLKIGEEGVWLVGSMRVRPSKGEEEVPTPT